MNFQEIRQKYPDYNDMSDEDFAQKFHQKFYSDMDFNTFANKVGYSVKPTKQQETTSLGNELLTKVKQYLPDTDSLIGAGEAALGTITGLTTGGVAGALGGAQGIIDTMRDGTFGTQEGVKQSANKFHEYADMAIYTPKTEKGKEYSNKVGDVLNELIPLAALPQAQMLGSLAGPAKQQIFKGKQAAKEVRTNKIAEDLQNLRKQAETPKQENIQALDQSGNPLYGVQRDLFRETPEEIQARLRKQALEESEGIQRDYNGPQGDLFLGKGAQQESPLTRGWQEDAAWAAREAEQKALFDEDVFRNQINTEPLTLEPEQSSSLLDKFSQDRTTYRQSPNISNSQRGSVGIDKFGEFSKEVREQHPDVTGAELKQLWDIQNQRKELSARENKSRRLFGNVGKPAEFDKVSFTDLDPDKVIADLNIAEDSPKGENFYEKHGMSAGYMKAEAQMNPAVNQAIRYLKSTIDRRANQAENKLFKAGVNKADGVDGLYYALTKGENLLGPGSMADLVKQWWKAKDNPEFKFNLDSKQQRINEIKEKLFSEIFEGINSRLPDNKKIEEMPFYIPSVHDGKFVINVQQREGSRPILRSFHNRFQAQAAKALAERQGYTASNVKEREHIKNRLGDTLESQAANFQYALDLMTDQDPTVRKFAQDLDRTLASLANTTAGEHNRLKDYKGFRGNLGNDPFKSDRRNYYDTKKMLVNTVESYYKWQAAQDGLEFSRKMGGEEGSNIGSNNRRMVQDYINESVIGNRYNDSIGNIIQDMVQGISGFDASAQKKVVRNVGNLNTALMTSFGSPIHALQNVVQPLTVTLPEMVRVGFNPVLATKGLVQGAVEYALMFSGKQASEIAKIFTGKDMGFVNVSKISKNLQSKLDYADRAGIITPTIVDASPIFDTKASNRVANFVMQGILSKPSEQAARWTTFSTLADYYEGKGMPREQAYNLARERTENYMVDYGQDARAGVWKSTGMLGDAFGRLQSFATNQFSTTYTRGKQAVKGGLNDKAAFLTYLGTLAAIGGLAGVPMYDAVESIVNNLKSKDGQTFSLRNYVRKNVGDWAMDGAWGLTGLGAAPSFATRTVNTDGDVPIPAMLGMPIAGRITEQARTVGQRIGGEDWNVTPQYEKGRQIQSVTPVAVRGLVEDAYLKSKVGDDIKHISPKTGQPLYTEKPGETSFGNIRSIERSRNSELSSEQFKEKQRFFDQRKKLEQKIDGLGEDIFLYGNRSDMKERRFSTLLSDYVTKYAGDPEKRTNMLQRMAIQYHVDDRDIAELIRIGQKQDLKPDDIRQILFYKKYQQMRKDIRQ